MRFFVVALLVICCFSCTVSQTKYAKRGDFPIKHSLHKPSKDLPEFVSHKNQIIFEITDVNPYLYSIAFSEMQRDVITDIELSTNKTPNYSRGSNFDIESLDVGNFSLLSNKKEETISVLETDGLKTFDNLEEQIRAKSEEKLSLTNEISVIERKKDSILIDSNSMAASTNLRTAQINTWNDEINALKNKIGEAERYKRTLERERKEFIQNMKSDAKKTELFKRQLDNYIVVANEIREKVSFYNDLQILLHTNISFKEIDERKGNLVREYFPRTNNIFKYCSGLLGSLDREFNYIVDIYNSFSDNGKVKFSMDIISAYHSKMKGKKFDNLFVEIKSLLNSVRLNNWTFQYQTTAISDKADKISFDLKATPIRNKYSKVFYPVNYNYNFYIRGGVKIDVSAGLFWNMGMFDDEYQLEEMGDSTQVYSINPIISSKPTFGTLFNIYRRSNQQIKPSLNVGLGTDIEKLYYYFGGRCNAWQK